MTERPISGSFPRGMADQVGIRDAVVYRMTDEERLRIRSVEIADRRPFPDRAWRMVDRIDALNLDGGPHGLGFVRGSTLVDPAPGSSPHTS